MTMKRVLLVLALAWPAHMLAADVRPFVKAGYDLGGDKVAEVVFTDGDSESIKANEGFYFGGGASIVTDAGTQEIELSISYKVGSVNGSNGDVEFRRFPLEALWFYRFAKVRLGGGLTYHLNPELDGSGVVGGGLDVKFDDALGLVLQGDYRFGEKLTIGLRYTNLEYKVSGASAKAKADGLGVTFGYRF
jgi:Outer membrane protein beta-barrel domain